MISRARQLARSDYGREFGWHIEYEGEVIGELVDPVFEEMFWESYRLIPTSEEGERLLMQSAMWAACVFRYRNKVLHEYPAHAFPGRTGVESLREGRISMRGLYLLPKGRIETLVLKVEAWFERRRLRK